jgi:hypothetical protein
MSATPPDDPHRPRSKEELLEMAHALFAQAYELSRLLGEHFDPPSPDAPHFDDEDRQPTPAENVLRWRPHARRHPRRS